MFTQPFHDFNTHNTFLSEGAALAVVAGNFPETPHQTRDNRNFPRLLRKSEARLCLACPWREGSRADEEADCESNGHRATLGILRISTFTQPQRSR